MDLLLAGVGAFRSLLVDRPNGRTVPLEGDPDQPPRQCASGCQPADSSFDRRLRGEGIGRREGAVEESRRLREDRKENLVRAHPLLVAHHDGLGIRFDVPDGCTAPRRATLLDVDCAAPFRRVSRFCYG